MSEALAIGSKLMELRVENLYVTLVSIQFFDKGGRQGNSPGAFGPLHIKNAGLNVSGVSRQEIASSMKSLSAPNRLPKDESAGEGTVAEFTYFGS
jgi:hypothetical protein